MWLDAYAYGFWWAVCTMMTIGTEIAPCNPKVVFL